MVDVPQLPAQVMTPRSGKGRELMELLRKELGIPEGARWFEVRFGIDEPVTVKVEFIPRQGAR